jgi:hypothetical protein
MFLQALPGIIMVCSCCLSFEESDSTSDYSNFPWESVSLNLSGSLKLKFICRPKCHDFLVTNMKRPIHHFFQDIENFKREYELKQTTPKKGDTG